MDASVFNDVARGALILSESNHSIVNFFNPSEEKHCSLYFGNGLLSFITDNYLRLSTDGYSDAIDYIIEFNFCGMTINPVQTFLQDRKYIKVYYYMEGIFPNYNLMENTLIQAFSNADKKYGFGKNKMYCFKMVAQCYYNLGVVVKSYNVLGKQLFLGQSFTQDNRWFNVIDTNIGKNLLLSGHCNYFKRRINT